MAGRRLGVAGVGALTIGRGMMKTNTHDKIIVYLTANGKGTMSEIAAGIGICKATTSNALTVMQVRKLVYCPPQDTKRHRIYMAGILPAETGAKPKPEKWKGPITPRTYRAQIAFDGTRATDPANFRPVPPIDYVRHGKKQAPTRVKT